MLDINRSFNSLLASSGQFGNLIKSLNSERFRAAWIDDSIERFWAAWIDDSIEKFRRT